VIVRGVRWGFIYAFFLVLSIAVICHAGCPLLTHEDAANEREFQNVCQEISNGPLVTTGSGVPNFIPRKVGDEYIATSTGKVYFATSTVTSGSWAIVN
jgi:hypothetical protein